MQEKKEPGQGDMGDKGKQWPKDDESGKQGGQGGSQPGGGWARRSPNSPS